MIWVRLGVKKYVNSPQAPTAHERVALSKNPIFWGTATIIDLRVVVQCEYGNTGVVS
ncbi:hypothetical protein SAMN04488514_10747 [Kriegella aquimaris]|uniref:Uncharacterized protein n=1 Tax=Kriegella aquimaris TaxID=192904 RepID=A0A1G9S0D6_9FLAO|nr:hypothetical protein SAMN04488514_10747 [Kriegella aquimaris]